MPECRHNKISRNGPDAWSCAEARCDVKFVPVEALAEAVATLERENDDILDMVTGVFTATLWGLHQQASAKGAPEPDIDLNALTARVCEEQGHKRGDDGTCTRCGDSPFLGS